MARFTGSVDSSPEGLVRRCASQKLKKLLNHLQSRPSHPQDELDGSLDPLLRAPSEVPVWAPLEFWETWLSGEFERDAVAAKILGREEQITASLRDPDRVEGDRTSKRGSSFNTTIFLAYCLIPCTEHGGRIRLALEVADAYFDRLLSDPYAGIDEAGNRHILMYPVLWSLALHF